MIDQNTCLSGMCATVCPRHVIVDRRGIVANYRYINFIRQKPTETHRVLRSVFLFMHWAIPNRRPGCGGELHF